MSETPRVRDLLHIVRWRLEPAAAILFAFFLVFFMNVLLSGDADQRSAGAYIYGAGLNLILCFFFALLFEIAYALIRIIGAAFLRTGRLWTYSVPALSVFWLIVHPLLTSAGMIDVILHGTGMTTGIYITFLLALSLLMFIVLLVLPVFHGLNAAFLLAGILVARFLLLPLQNLLFPHAAAFSAIRFGVFLLIAFGLSSLLYVFFQARRRIGLSPHYEKFNPGRVWFIVLIPLFLAFSMGLFWLREGHRLFHPLLDVFYLNLATSLDLVVLFLLLLLKREARRSEGYRLPTMQTAAFLGILLVVVTTSLVRAYRPEYIFFARESAAGRFLELVSVTADRDGDGNSSWPGQDPDDGNPAVRREGRGEYKNSGLGEVRASGYAGSDRVLVTVAIPGSLEHNPLYENSGSVDLEFSGPGPRFWMQPSNVPERSLRAMMQGLTSFEEIHGLEKRSLFSIAAEDGYRTLCIGMDDGSGYFRLNHPARLDRGCQIFEPLPAPEFKPAPDESPVTACLAAALVQAEKLVEQYREKHTFVWIHLDARRCPIPEIEKTSDVSKREHLETERNREVQKAAAVALSRLKTFHPEYFWLSNPSRRLLIVHMQTGFLPLFHVNARDEFWRAKDGDFLYSSMLTGHLFFFRWYFADQIRAAETASDEDEKKSRNVLLAAERAFQQSNPQDLNRWVFLQENPDENIRWFREVIGLEGTTRQFPASTLYYDARAGRLIYSHGMWNRSLSFHKKENQPAEVEEAEEPTFFPAPAATTAPEEGEALPQNQPTTPAATPDPSTTQPQESR